MFPIPTILQFVEKDKDHLLSANHYHLTYCNIFLSHKCKHPIVTLPFLYLSHCSFTFSGKLSNEFLTIKIIDFQPTTIIWPTVTYFLSHKCKHPIVTLPFLYLSHSNFTFSGKLSNEFLTASLLPNLEDLKRLMMSCRVAATKKYSCFKRNSLPSKNWNKINFTSW